MKTIKKKKNRKIDSRIWKDEGYVEKYIIINGVRDISEL